jgi:hypothetical protein
VFVKSYIGHFRYNPMNVPPMNVPPMNVPPDIRGRAGPFRQAQHISQGKQSFITENNQK